MPRGKSQKTSYTAYFREQFQRNPDWLTVKSSQSVLEQWQTDHPGQEITKQVKTALQNAKMAEKEKQGIKGKQGKRKKAAAVAVEAPSVPSAGGELERLEMMIDNCLTVARTLEDRKLNKAVSYLRAARNQVVLQQGE